MLISGRLFESYLPGIRHWSDLSHICFDCVGSLVTWRGIRFDLFEVGLREARGESGETISVRFGTVQCVSQRQCWLCQHALQQGVCFCWTESAEDFKASQQCLLSMRQVSIRVCAWARGLSFSSSFLLSDQSSFEVWLSVKSWQIGRSASVVWFCLNAALVLHTCAYFIHLHQQSYASNSQHIWDFPSSQVTKTQTWEKKTPLHLVLQSSTIAPASDLPTRSGHHFSLKSCEVSPILYYTNFPAVVTNHTIFYVTYMAYLWDTPEVELNQHRSYSRYVFNSI